MWMMLKKIGRKLMKALQPSNRIVVPKAQGAPKDAWVPEGAKVWLRADNVELIRLKEDYKQSHLPMSVHSFWGSERVEDDLELLWFRGDNAYVWQTRHMGGNPKLRYFLYAKDVFSRDRLRLQETLQEDGAFGVWSFEYEAMPKLSRDLIDSVNELDFLEEHLGIRDGGISGIIDIGAGYGRLAHRACEAWPELQRYVCTDGVAESTFVCDYYTKFRDLRSRVEVTPVTEVDDLNFSGIDLMVNVHSFSEMRYEAIEAWLTRMAEADIKYLFIIPNDPDEFLSIESDHSRRDFAPLIAKLGYELEVKRPAIVDPDVREFVGVKDNFYLFARNDVL